MRERAWILLLLITGLSGYFIGFFNGRQYQTDPSPPPLCTKTDETGLSSALPRDDKASEINRILAPINLNQATAEGLTRLPGIGEKLAGRIIEDRDKRGPYKKPEDLLRISGIGPKLLNKITPYLVFY